MRPILDRHFADVGSICGRSGVGLRSSSVFLGVVLRSFSGADPGSSGQVWPILGLCGVELFLLRVGPGLRTDEADTTGVDDHTQDSGLWVLRQRGMHMFGVMRGQQRG